MIGVIVVAVVILLRKSKNSKKPTKSNDGMKTEPNSKLFICLFNCSDGPVQLFELSVNSKTNYGSVMGNGSNYSPINNSGNKNENFATPSKNYATQVTGDEGKYNLKIEEITFENEIGSGAYGREFYESINRFRNCV